MKITRVRLDEQESEEALQSYVFGGHYGPIRVPRGIEPERVSRFIRAHVSGETDSEDFAKALEAIRFYERKDLVAHFAPMLVGQPAMGEPFQRQAFVCQILGDFGEPADAAKAAAHFDRFLVLHPQAISSSSLMFDTLLAMAPMAPAGGLAAYARSVTAEVERLAPEQRKDEASMRAHDKVAAIKRNDLPRLKALVEFKGSLAAQKPPERRHELVELYLGRAKISNSYLEVWGARMLRLEALGAGSEPAKEEFGKVLNSVPVDRLGKEKTLDALVNRSARAFRYFEGTLSEDQKKKVTQAKTSTLDFLDDD